MIAKKKTNNEGKKVLLVTKNLVGGIRTYFKYIYSKKEFDGYSFVVITPSPGLSDYLSTIFADKKFEYIECRSSNYGFMIDVWRILLRRKFHLIHSHGITSGLLVSPLAKIISLPHLMTLHDIFQDGQFRGKYGFLKKWLIGLGLRIIDCSMSVSKDAQNNLSFYYPFLKKGSKLAHIQNGIDTDEFINSSARDFQRELELPEDCVLIGFFGRFMKQKGFRILVDAVQKLNDKNPEINFRVITFGWGGYIREEQAYIDSLKIGHLFYFMPHTDEMNSALRGVDVVVMPSLWEACPLLPMESLVSGVSLIASDCIGLREVVEDTPAIVFKQGSVSELHKSLILFLENPNKYNTLAKEYVNHAYDRYDAEVSAKKLLLQYRRMMENG